MLIYFLISRDNAVFVADGRDRIVYEALPELDAYCLVKTVTCILYKDYNKIVKGVASKMFPQKRHLYIPEKKFDGNDYFCSKLAH